MPIIRASHPVVRHIGSSSFRDRPEPEPVKSEPPESPVLRRNREEAAAGRGLSSAAARARGGTH